MVRQLTLPFEDRGEAPKVERSAELRAAGEGAGHSGASDVMEQIVQGRNLDIAWDRVRKNKGSPGIDGMTVEELQPYWLRHREAILQRLLAGTYEPQPVRRHEIPKSGGGMRELGIPTVLDRFIQQAFLQVLQPLFDGTFSEHSYGFRPGRSAHGAIRAAQQYVQEGHRWVVDIDLEKFFDRVNHDVLMSRLARRISDRRVLRIIRRYLEAGVMLHGVVIERFEGTPQGGPLSPLLANVLLDEVDQMLTAHGHRFVRYADDCNVYVRSRRAGERVMQTLRRKYEGLHLKVNEAKSAVAPAATRKILGYSFWFARGGRVECRVASKALEEMKARVRIITKRTRGRSMATVVNDLRSYLRGWLQYFGFAATPKKFAELDQWIRRRLRALHLKQWRRGRTIYRELVKLGAPSDLAAKIAAYGWRRWHTAGHSLNIILTTRYFDRMGVPHLGA